MSKFDARVGESLAAQRGGGSPAAGNLILLEFNELCPPLLTRWMAEGRLPNFKRFHDASAVFITEADERAAPNLEPWIQWYSVHTGLP